MKHKLRSLMESNSPLRITLMVLYDIAFSTLAFYLAHYIIFFRLTPDNSAYPLNYNYYVFLLAIVSIFINVTMLAVTGN